MLNGRTWTGGMSEPDATLLDMLLTEPGSRVEGPTEEVLRCLYWAIVSHAIDHDGMDPDAAEHRAISLLPWVHHSLANGAGTDAAGFVVRTVPDD